VDGLLAAGIIKPTTGVILVCQDTNNHIHDYDNPLLLLDFLSTPFSEKDVIVKIMSLAKAIILFKPTLTFISNDKLSFAYKALNTIPKDNISIDIIEKFLKLKINLTFEMGNFTQVVSICSKPNVKGKPWSLWPNLKANYELGNWEYCHQFLSEESFIGLPAGSMKLFWQLRILLQQQKFEDAIDVINTYPSNEMPASTVRLVFLVFTFAQRFKEAQEFIERKIRLAKPNSLIYAKLTVSLFNIYLYDYLTSASNDKAKILDKLELRLNSFSKKLVAKKFSTEVSLINIYLLIIKAGTKPDLISNAKNRLEELSKLNDSPMIKCQIAYAWYLVGDHKKAFDALVSVDATFDSMPLGSERLILGLVQTQIFYAMYHPEKKFDAYHRFGDRHVDKQRYKLACKSYVRALQLENNEHVKEKLHKAMIDADLPHLSGHQLIPDNDS
jgi:tetratricopeptide (TPR) repeat protein